MKTNKVRRFKTLANNPSIFGDARDTYDASKPQSWPCTSARSRSTMPRRERGPHNKSGYVPA